MFQKEFPGPSCNVFATLSFFDHPPRSCAVEREKSFMASGPKSAEEYRAMALLCRQQAACDPDKSWRLLGEAERWEYLAEQQSASDSKECNFPQSGRRATRLARPVSG
jgi:hypothetical protein